MAQRYRLYRSDGSIVGGQGWFFETEAEAVTARKMLEAETGKTYHVK